MYTHYMKVCMGYKRSTMVYMDDIGLYRDMGVSNK